MLTSNGSIRSVRDQIIDQLRNEVLADELPPHQPLREVELAERFGVRRQIETTAIVQVFDRLTVDDDDQWREMPEQLHRACEKEDMPSIVKHDIAFHRSLVRRTDSRDLEAIWLTITFRIRLRYSRHKSLIEIYDEHARIVDHIHRRNLKAAVRLLGKHIV